MFFKGLLLHFESSKFEVPLILFPGMGANARIFQHQCHAFENLTVPDWISPKAGDDLTTYCRRFAQSIGPARPCIVGGASFGGVIALEMTKHFDALACILIGSIKGPHQLPRRIRILRPLSSILNFVPISLFQTFATISNHIANRIGNAHIAELSRQFASADPALIHWSVQQILHWRSSSHDIDIRHIHGDCDQVIPIRCLEPDEIIEGGGHVITMTHGDQVNEFLRKQISLIVAKQNIHSELN